MAAFDYPKFLKYLFALLLGQIIIGAFMSLFQGFFTGETEAMTASISSPSISFLLLAYLVFPVTESGILVFFIWALGTMKAHGWVVCLIAGLLFGLMHASFGVGKIAITVYAGIVYCNLFLRAGGGPSAFLQMCALHMANNLVVVGGVAFISMLHGGQ